LLETLLPRFGARVYLAGANYVWGWEMNRLARELVTEAGGEIVGERCLPIEETQVGRLIAEIEARRPAFVLSNLIGPSSHAFLKAMRTLADRDAAFAPVHCPVVSCDLTECELAEIGPGIADGQLAAASYFSAVQTPRNAAFLERVADAFGPSRPISSFFATSYATVRACVEAVERCGSDDPALVRAALHLHRSDSVLGPLVIDPATNHAALPFHLGRIAGDGFEILRSEAVIAADPYLLGRRRSAPRAPSRPQLRIVS
jgi:branched-chain amino acid transport system substrate-binding protein